MARGRRYKPEQVVTLLRQIEVALANGKTAAQACREVGIVDIWAWGSPQVEFVCGEAFAYSLYLKSTWAEDR